MYSTTNASAAIKGGTRVMYCTSDAGEVNTSGPGAMSDMAGAAKMYSTTGARVAHPVGADATSDTADVGAM